MMVWFVCSDRHSSWLRFQIDVALPKTIRHVVQLTYFYLVLLLFFQVPAMCGGSSADIQIDRMWMYVHQASFIARSPWLEWRQLHYMHINYSIDLFFLLRFFVCWKVFIIRNIRGWNTCMWNCLYYYIIIAKTITQLMISIDSVVIIIAVKKKKLFDTRTK